jgi:hypothetical protein
MKNSQKGSAVIVTILLVVIVAGGIWFYASRNTGTNNLKNDNDRGLGESTLDSSTKSVDEQKGATSKTELVTAPCGIKLALRGLSFSADKCTFSSVTGHTYVENLKTYVTRSSITISNNNGDRGFVITIPNFNSGSGGPYVLSSTKKDLEGTLVSNNAKLTSGTATIKVLADNKIDVSFDVTFEGGAGAKGSGIISSRRELQP